MMDDTVGMAKMARRRENLLCSIFDTGWDGEDSKAVLTSSSVCAAATQTTGACGDACRRTNVIVFVAVNV